MRNALLTLTLAAALLATGCSASGEPPVAASSTAAGTPSAPVSAASTSAVRAEPTNTTSAKPTAKPSVSAKPAEPVGACLGGRYVLVRFSGLSAAADLTATGRDVTATFADGQYTLKAAGKSRYTLTNGKNKAVFTLKGTMNGRYTAKGSAVRYTLTSAEGSGELAGNGASRRATMDEISKTVAPRGTAPTTCSHDRLTIENPQAKLEFERR